MVKNEVKKVVEISFTQEEADKCNKKIKEKLQDRKRIIIKGRTEYAVEAE